MGALSMVVLEFVLGTGVNLYVKPARGGLHEAFANGPLLAMHAVLGILLVVAAFDLMIRAIIAGHRPVITGAAIGLLSILGAAFYGIGFLRTGSAAASMGMTVAAGVSMLCYGFCLRVLGSAERARR